MKTDLSRPMVDLWQAISEVPGWPDAPLLVRLRRLWPLALPATGCLGLAIWIFAVREPQHSAIRTAHSEILAIEDDISVLRQDCSEQLAVDTIAQAAAARAELLESPRLLAPGLDEFTSHARALGWDAVFQVYGLAEDHAAGANANVAYAPARLRLTPRGENVDPFNSLLAALAALTEPPSHLEITRVSIRAESPGEPVAEVNLRAACRPSDEKTVQ